MVGIGMHARRLHAYLTADGGRDVEAFAVHRRFLDADDALPAEFLDRPLVAFEELDTTHPPDTHELCVTVGYRDVNQARARVWQEGLDRGYEHVNYASSYVRRWEPSTVGTRGTHLVEDTNVQPYVTIGDDCWIAGSRVGHESRVGDHCWITGATIAADVTVGEFCFIGVGATILDGVTIAPRTVVGAGALIKRDTVEGAVYSARGTPARTLKSWDLRNL